MQRLLYVASLPHSGSTLFALLMAHHPQMLSIGGLDESMRLLMRDPEKTGQLICTCGASARECQYWGAVMTELSARMPETIATRYQLALAVFARIFGNDIWAVDSGQIKEPLYALASEKWLDLRVVHLVRDVRSAVVSHIEKRERKGRRRSLGFTHTVPAAWRWWRENEKIARSLAETRLPGKGLGYEELCLAFPQAFDGLCDFLKLERVAVNEQVPRTKNHMIIGNRMRRQAGKGVLMYDGRWLTRSSWLLPTLLLPFVLRRNREWVYGNNIFAAFSR